jgi:hypothetical protein
MQQGMCLPATQAECCAWLHVWLVIRTAWNQHKSQWNVCFGVTAAAAGGCGGGTSF